MILQGCPKCEISTTHSIHKTIAHQLNEDGKSFEYVGLVGAAVRENEVEAVIGVESHLEMVPVKDCVKYYMNTNNQMAMVVVVV